jgi:hypothetical protein
MNMIQAAQDVHGRATVLQKAGEFPAPLEHEYRVSEDAIRYYQSGKSFAYRHLPFWLASLVDRMAIVLVPLPVLLLPGLRAAPAPALRPQPDRAAWRSTRRQLNSDTAGSSKS